MDDKRWQKILREKRENPESFQRDAHKYLEEVSDLVKNSLAARLRKEERVTPSEQIKVTIRKAKAKKAPVKKAPVKKAKKKATKKTK